LADSASEALPADDAEALLATPPPAEIVSFPGTSTRQTLRQPAAPSGPEADGVRQRPAAPAAPPIPLRPGSARGGETPTAPPAAKDGEGGAARFAGARGSTTRSGGGKGADGPPLPATQTQLETIAKLARGAGRTVATEGLTRAAASELITRLSEERYGARRST
ncbi:MAG: hypothetical protein ACRDI2_00880, partial [Chloroflexota bacterium]